MTERIPFNLPHTTGRETTLVQEAMRSGHLSADGTFTRRAQAAIAAATGARTALLVHSCTAALEMAIRLAGVGPGDEVILPSYTFPSSATAIVAAGGTPVFVDVEASTLTIDPDAVAAAVTRRTRAVMPVHYAGVGADMAPLLDLARSEGLRIIEDAAQGMYATWDGRPLGAIGDLGALSFHETKNIHCGEGGALLVNDEQLAARAEYLRDKGTNRQAFLRGEVPAYTWVDEGSSYGLSELNAAFLCAQIDAGRQITDARLERWERYHALLADAEQGGLLRRPIIPAACAHNAHMYYVLLTSAEERQHVLRLLDAAGIGAVFHYQPLHASPAGRRLGRVGASDGRLPVSEALSARIIRLPLHLAVTEDHQQRVVQALLAAISSCRARSGGRRAA